MTLKPCIACGELGENSRCTDCSTEHRKTYGGTTQRPSRAAGYDSAWDRLSKRARRMQPWCSDCGRDDDLNCDHSAEAWQRKAEGLPIRLRDVDVLCRVCNIDRGSSRPGGMRYPNPSRSLSAEAKFPSENGYQL